MECLGDKEVAAQRAMSGVRRRVCAQMLTWEELGGEEGPELGWSNGVGGEQRPGYKCQPDERICSGAVGGHKCGFSFFIMKLAKHVEKEKIIQYAPCYDLNCVPAKDEVLT